MLGWRLGSRCTPSRSPVRKPSGGTSPKFRASDPLARQHVRVTSPSSLTASKAAVPRPRARSIGVTLLCLGGLLLPALYLATPAKVCEVDPWVAGPLGAALTTLVLLAGAALALQRPRTSAVAPALALGAAFPLLGQAIGGIVWVATTECAPSLLDARSGLLVVQAGAAIAVTVTAGWLLYVRDEIEPWSGTRGVVIAAAAGLALLTVSVGVIVVWGIGGHASVWTAALAGPIPWALAITLTGWLRRSPALALMMGSLLQAIFLTATLG